MLTRAETPSQLYLLVKNWNEAHHSRLVCGSSEPTQEPCSSYNSQLQKMLSAHPSNSHLKHNLFAGMCRWRAQQTLRCGRVTVIEFGTSKRRAAARSWHVNNAAECSVWRGKKTGQRLQRSRGMWETGQRQSESRWAMSPSREAAFSLSLHLYVIVPPHPSTWHWGMMRAVGAEFTGGHVEAVLNYPASCPFSSISSSFWGIKDGSVTEETC